MSKHDLGIRNAEHFAALGQVASLRTLRDRLKKMNDTIAPGKVDRCVFVAIDSLMLELAGNEPAKPD